MSGWSYAADRTGGRCAARIEPIMNTPHTVTRMPPDSVIAFDDGLGSSGVRRRPMRSGVGLASVLLESVPCSSLVGSAPLSAIAWPYDSGARGWQACVGCSPDSWLDPWLAYEWPAEYARSGHGATRFEEVFGSEAGYAGMTFLDVLQLRTNEDRDEVARHAVAAVLNSAIGLTPAECLGIDVLRAMWHSYAVLGYCIPVPGVKWYANGSAPPGAGSILQWLKSTMRG
jgi:hypothetical protein